VPHQCVPSRVSVALGGIDGPAHGLLSDAHDAEHLRLLSDRILLSEEHLMSGDGLEIYMLAVAGEA
jgi:hypothetical protein